MTPMETDEVQRLSRAIQAATRAARSGQPLGGGFGMQGGDAEMEQLGDAARERIREALRERVAEVVRERLHDAARDRVRELLRQRLAQEIRSALVEAQVGPSGFDFDRASDRLSERFSEAVNERKVCVVTFFKELRASIPAVAVSSSGASKTMTPS